MKNKKHNKPSCSLANNEVTLRDSPHRSRICEFTFGRNKDGPLKISFDILKKSSDLATLAENGYRTTTYTRVHLENVEIDVGNVIISHLYSGGYERNQWEGSSREAENQAAFNTAIGVWASARKYDIPSLVGLAKNEICRLGDELSVNTVAKTLSQCNATTAEAAADNSWQPAIYLDFRVQSLIRDWRMKAVANRLEDIDDGQDVASIILRGVARSMEAPVGHDHATPAFVFGRRCCHEHPESVTMDDSSSTLTDPTENHYSLWISEPLLIGQIRK